MKNTLKGTIIVKNGKPLVEYFDKDKYDRECRACDEICHPYRHNRNEFVRSLEIIEDDEDWLAHEGKSVEFVLYMERKINTHVVIKAKIVTAMVKNKNPRNMKRFEVFNAVSSELDYQDELKADPNRPDIIEDMHVGDTISAIQHNLNKALNYWYKNSTPHDEAMSYLRKIAALCIQAGEKYGMPKRQNFSCVDDLPF